VSPQKRKKKEEGMNMHAVVLRDPRSQFFHGDRSGIQMATRQRARSDRRVGAGAGAGW